MIELLGAFDPALLLAFVAAGLLLNLTPGVDFIFVSASGIAGGPTIGMAAGLGTTLGVVVHLLAAVGGVSALLITFPWLFGSIKIVGGIYLLILAWRALNDTSELGTAQSANSAHAAIKRGFITNVLNPKTALFIFAFIPQFADPSIGSVPAQILILGTIFLINGLIFILILGALAGILADKLRARVKFLNKITAILFGGIAAKLMID